jgi:hypothetical protein
VGFTEFLAEFGGSPVVGFPPDPGASVPPAARAAADVAWRIDVRNEKRPAEPFMFEDVFHRFLTTVDTSRVTALVVGLWADPPHTENHHPARLLAESAKLFPALRALFLGDVLEGHGDGECDIVYIDHPDLRPILDAFPRLEELWVRGAPDGDNRPWRYFEPHQHTGLRSLVLQSGGLPTDTIRAISECDFPELRHLELYIGHPAWMGQARPEDLAWLMTGSTFPELEHLGLRNSLIQDGLAAALAHAPIVAGLKVLDLSLGAFGDEGAAALLHGQPLNHLHKLDLHHNYLSHAMRERLRTAWPGVEVDLSWHRTEDQSGRRYVGVGG